MRRNEYVDVRISGMEWLVTYKKYLATKEQVNRTSCHEAEEPKKS